MSKNSGLQKKKKVVILQPYFSDKMEDAEECFEQLLSLFDKCDESSDVIVLPEYCDVPINTKSDEDFFTCVKRYNERVMTKAKETAVRCDAVVFINCSLKNGKGYRNTTFAIDRSGNTVGRYYKAHLAPSEYSKFDYSYCKEAGKPYVIEIDGVRYGFLTCFDFYFYEDYINLAREKIDVIIGCSHQRTDTHRSLEIFGQFLAYNTNAYLFRSSISLKTNKKICGCGMVVSPDGRILLNMKNRVGSESVTVDLNKKYYKPAGFMGEPKAHYEYVDGGRKYLQDLLNK